MQEEAKPSRSPKKVLSLQNWQNSLSVPSVRVSNFQSIFYGPYLFGIADVAHSRSTDASVALSAKRQYIYGTHRKMAKMRMERKIWLLAGKNGNFLHET